MAQGADSVWSGRVGPTTSLRDRARTRSVLVSERWAGPDAGTPEIPAMAG